MYQMGCQGVPSLRVVVLPLARKQISFKKYRWSYLVSLSARDSSRGSKNQYYFTDTDCEFKVSGNISCTKSKSYTTVYEEIPSYNFHDHTHWPTWGWFTCIYCRVRETSQHTQISRFTVIINLCFTHIFLPHTVRVQGITLIENQESARTVLPRVSCLIGNISCHYLQPKLWTIEKCKFRVVM